MCTLYTFKSQNKAVGTKEVFFTSLCINITFLKLLLSRISVMFATHTRLTATIKRQHTYLYHKVTYMLKNL